MRGCRVLYNLVKHLEWIYQGRSVLEILEVSIALPPREKAIYLLYVSAEVEHGLMVQYLYAAYSLGGKHLELNYERQRVALSWRNVFIEIARQEMGHLATVQNILTLLDDPLRFERQDYQVPSGLALTDRQSLYPFPFALEPLTKKSLGKYVLAEMPSGDNIKKLEKMRIIEAGEIDAIKRVVGVDRAWRPVRVHRVGAIYQKIKELFQPPQPDVAYIEDSDIRVSAQLFQAQPS